jgi:hypothetical protein
MVLLESVGENFCELPRVTILSTIGIQELYNKVRYIGLLLDEKNIKNVVCLLSRKWMKHKLG